MSNNINKQTVDKLTILFPAQKLQLNGEEVEIKEYTLLQQLQHNALFMPFVSSLRTTLSKDEAEFGLEPLMACISAHYQDVLDMVALSINKPVEFVNELTGEDADAVLLTWWTVNSDFFTRKAMQPILERLAKQQAETLIGAKSSNT
jgi:hypothetical protein|nr:MAG TPA: hypothetical protein [Caudoviricetes sp.]